MSNLKKIAVLLLCVAFMFTFFQMAFATDEIEFECEEIESCIGEAEDEAEEKEYIVCFNDSAVSLYAEDGKDYVLMNEEELNAAIEEGVVEHYEENAWVYLFGDVDPMQTVKWDVNMLNADYAFERGYTGSGVKVAVIDSGCNETGDLSDNILPGYNLVDGSSDVTDSANHGTMVSAQIAAEANSVGFRGVAPDAKIVPLKIFEGKKAKVNLLVDAIYMAVNTYDCDIINMSLGTRESSEVLKTAVDYAVSKNVLVISAAGNYKDEDNKELDIKAYPAAYDNVIAVGAVDSKKKICSYSFHNDGVDVCAPGGRPKEEDKPVYCLTPPNAVKPYFESYGTSFAAPLVTGIAAIFRGIDSDFSHEDFMEIIMAVSTDLGDSGYDKYYGYGLADIEKYFKYYFAPVGDNNADGLVTSADAKRIAEYVVGKRKSFIKEKMADVNKDGIINMLDAILVARAAEGWDGYDLPYNK